MGCPIRKFSDQSLHTAPRNLSQYITSFIGFQCQGIRHTPLNAWFMHRKKFCVWIKFCWNVHLFEHSWLFIYSNNRIKILIIIIKIFTVIIAKCFLVEDSGIEPLTSWMQIRRSPSWANPPVKKMVGRERLELSTPPLSRVCSNQLSYRPFSQKSETQTLRREMRTVNIILLYYLD